MRYVARDFARVFYNSKAWKLCRKSFIAYRISVDGGMCEHCRTELGYICDHKEELTPDNINDPEITLNHDNLQYLCLACHNKKTFGSAEGALRDDVMFASNGDLIRSG